MSVPPLPYAGMSPPPEPDRPLGPNGLPMPRGRKRGSRNKVSATLKQAILLAAEEVGDDIADEIEEKEGREATGGLQEYLSMVARADIKAFAALLGKVLPMEITGAGGGALEVMFKTVYEENAPKPPGPDRGLG